MSAHSDRVDRLVEAYKSGRTLATTVKVRDYLIDQGYPCTISTAYSADIEVRNQLNADPTTSTVLPAAKVPDPGTRDYARRSRGDANHDLWKVLAFGQEVITKAKNLTFQAKKTSDKHHTDIDIMRFARDAAAFGQQAVALQIEIERIKASRENRD